MRLYVNCPNGHRIYFRSSAECRSELPYSFQRRCPYDHEVYIFYQIDVQAETEIGPIAGGAVLGGLVGLLAGPIGVLIGAGLGATIGASHEAEEQQKVRRFYEC
jgi:hypothetical protein